MRILFSLFGLVCLLACHKSVTPPACGIVAGITPRDVNGAPIGAGDTTDWGYTDDWCADVEALFAGRPPVVVVGTVPDPLVMLAYPNPSQTAFQMGFFRDDTGYVDVRFVDTDFQLLHAQDSITTNQLLFTAAAIGISTPQLIRAYYRVVHPDGTAHRGHGDVRMDL